MCVGEGGQFLISVVRGKEEAYNIFEFSGAGWWRVCVVGKEAKIFGIGGITQPQNCGWVDPPPIDGVGCPPL